MARILQWIVAYAAVVAALPAPPAQGWSTSASSAVLPSHVVHKERSPSTSRVIPLTHVVHEERNLLASRWVRRDRVPPSTKLPIRIGLTQRNLENGPNYLRDIADPHSHNFGKHWTAEQVIDAFKPAQDTVDAVRSWLVDAGFSNRSITHTQNQAWLAFDATVNQMEELLHTEFWEFQDHHTGSIAPACDRYHIPRHVQKHIDYITPGIRLLPPLHSPPKHMNRGLADNHSTESGHNHTEVYGEWAFPPSWIEVTDPKSNLEVCNQTITPACISALYDIPPAHLADPSNSMGIFQTSMQMWDQPDLDNFFDWYTDIPDGTHPVNKLVDGAVATSNISTAGPEVMLDLEIAYPIVYPQTITIWNVDDMHKQASEIGPNAFGKYNGMFNTFLDAIDGSYCTSCAYGECGNLPRVDPIYPNMLPGPDGYQGELQCGVFEPTNVISVSYGFVETEVPIAYQKRQCMEFLKLGLRGTSFIFASGDSGVAEHACYGPDEDIFSPSWPGNCPWVTTVGATGLYNNRSVHERESAAFGTYPNSSHIFSSGGGFSNVYPAPWYQETALDAFFGEHDPPYTSYSGLVSDHASPYAMPDVAALAGTSGGIYNRVGRGIPDVATNGDQSVTRFRGYWLPGSGASMSAPIFAAIINRINEERLVAGKSTLGFLNPTLYKYPEMLNDITNGTNPGCGTPGFSAVEGWDPLTGHGTPNYPRMLEVFMSLPWT